MFPCLRRLSKSSNAEPLHREATTERAKEEKNRTLVCSQTGRTRSIPSSHPRPNSKLVLPICTLYMVSWRYKPNQGSPIGNETLRPWLGRPFGHTASRSRSSPVFCFPARQKERVFQTFPIEVAGRSNATPPRFRTAPESPTINPAPVLGPSQVHREPSPRWSRWMGVGKYMSGTPSVPLAAFCARSSSEDKVVR